MEEDLGVLRNHGEQILLRIPLRNLDLKHHNASKKPKKKQQKKTRK